VSASLPALGPRPLVVVGDALLDRDVEGRAERLSPDAPVPVVDEHTTRARPGGAGLAALLAAGGDRPVTLVTALADDAGGSELRGLLEAAGVELVPLPLSGATPEKVRICAAGRPLVRLDRGGDGEVGAATAAARAAIAGAAAVLVSDYGRGVAAEPGLREAIAGLPALIPVVWDPHPRGPAPTPGVLLATPNRDETRRLTGDRPGAATGGDLAEAARRAPLLREAWGASHVCVTLGAGGALLVGPDATPVAVPAQAARGGDPCGAGDRFASAAALALAGGAALSEAVGLAVRVASAFVASGGAGAVDAGRGPGAERPADAVGDLLARVRGGGGTVVATGGCFDLLHAGHVRTLRAARNLGDCLVVLLNADSSVTRLKGADRPIQPQEDRVAVLSALDCVDAVVTFEEDTPEAALDRIRPDLWAKGGDYTVEDLPEARLLSSWGGQAVILPFLPGRSTTRLLEKVLDAG